MDSSLPGSLWVKDTECAFHTHVGLHDVGLHDVHVGHGDITLAILGSSIFIDLLVMVKKHKQIAKR